jgi:hypothetical protein
MMRHMTCDPLSYPAQARMILFRDCFVIPHIGFEASCLPTNFPGNFDRYHPSKTLQLPQQPKTKPDDAFGIAAGSETLGPKQNAPEIRRTLGRIGSPRCTREKAGR